MDRPEVKSAWKQYGFQVAKASKKYEYNEEKAVQNEFRQKIEDYHEKRALEREADLFYGVDL